MPISLSQFYALMDASPIGVFHCDQYGNCNYANSKWLATSGATLAQTLNKGWIDGLHSDDLAKVVSRWCNAQPDGDEFEMEFRVRRPSGEIRFLTARSCVIDSLIEADLGHLSFIQDITELRQNEAKGHEQSRILESSLNEIYIFDADTFCFEFVNKSARQNLGYSVEELQRMTAVDIKPLFSLTTFEEAIRPLKNHETELLQFRTLHRRADGSDYHVEVHLQMARNADKPAFLAIILDITQSILLEAQNASQLALQRAIVDNAAYAIIATTPSGVITRFNRAAEKLLGYAAEEMIQHHTPEVFHIKDEVLRRAEEFSHELGAPLEPGFGVFVEKTIRGLPNEHEWTYVRKDGAHVPVNLAITALRDDSSRITGFLGVAKDMSRRKQAEAELRLAKERLELAVHGSSDGLWDWNLQTAEVYLSPRCQVMLGLAIVPPLTTQQVFIGLIHPDDRIPYKAAVDSHLDNGVPFETTTRFRTQQGEWRWFRIRGEAVQGSDGLASRMAGSMSDITAQKNAEEKLAVSAITDQLTGLPNRSHFLHRMSGAISRATTSKSTFAVMFLDFDRFKSINDSWGHDVGDELLKQIANRLRAAVYGNIAPSLASRTVARLGGDEFVVLVENLMAPDDCQRILQDLQDILNRPYQLGKHQTHSSASIGIVFGPSFYEKEEDILRDADTAMYEAKQAGRARHVVFDTEMHIRARRRCQLELDLKIAIGTSQISLHYQPVVSLLTGEVNSVEASVRWTNPTLGPIDPDEFIPIAQESRLILQLSEWVLRESCKQCSLWHLSMGSAAPSQISVNLPRRHFCDPELPDLLGRILAETGLTPNRLLLEISHDCLTIDFEMALQTMKAISELGVGIAIDDFGMGTASFMTLHQFPVSLLKLDRSLIQQIENSKCEAAFLHGLVVMARNLKVKLVAEGVELRSQQKAVQELGCEFMQGSFFAKPMPAPELENFLADNRYDKALAVGAMAFAGGWSERLAFLEPAPN